MGKGIFATLVALIFLLPAASAVSSTDLPQNPTAVYLKILEQGVDVFEPLFTESATRVPKGGFYDFRLYQNWTHPRNEPYHTLCMIPGNGQVVLDYAVLLKYSDKAFFGRAGYPRELLLDHVRKTIRWICLTSAYVDKPYPFLPEIRADLARGEQWQRQWGLRQDLLGYLSIGVALLWDDLDEEIRGYFQQVATGVALRERLPRTAGSTGNGNHDQVKQDLSSTLAAAFLFPHHPENQNFMAAVRGAGLDMVSTPADFASPHMVGQHPLKELALGANLNPDYSSLHHNHPSLWYGVDLIFEGRLYVEILSRLTGIPVPQTYSYAGNGFDGVYRYATILATGDGVMMHLRSPEYDAYYGEGILAFCYGNVLKKDPVGNYLESKSAEVLSRHTQAVGEFDYHRGSWAKAALALLLHRLSGEPPAPFSADVQALDSLNGSYRFAELGAMVHRTSQSWRGFVWGPPGRAGAAGPGAYVVPSAASGPLIYNSNDSLAGAVLEHRPLWLYPLMLGTAILLAAGAYRVRRKGPDWAEAFYFMALSLLVAALLVAWIDLAQTLPLRIPSAVVPRWPFAAVCAVAAAVMLGNVLAMGNTKPQTNPPAGSWCRALVAALFIVPVTLLTMIRTPWVDIFDGGRGGDWLWVYCAGLLICLILCSANRKKITLFAVAVVAIFLLVFSLVSLGISCFSENPELLYLRLVSIRNFPRIRIIGLAGLGILLAGFAFSVWSGRKWLLWSALHLATVLFASCLAVALLSIGRFDLPQVSNIHAEISDDGFSSAGEVQTSVVRGRQAFFSFENGPAIIFLDLIGKKRSLVSWSGLPLPFYQRKNYVATRTVYHRGGESLIPALKNSVSPWLNVDDQLGLVFSGANQMIAGHRQLGANWARTETYLDRVDILAVSPEPLRMLESGEALESLAAGIYPAVGAKETEQYAAQWRLLDQAALPQGWKGVLAPLLQESCLVAVANLGSKAGTSDLRLSWDNWAPVFGTAGIVSGRALLLSIRLDPFETFRDHSFLLLRADPEARLQARRLGPGRYELIPLSENPPDLMVRWTGPKFSQVTVENQAGVKEIAWPAISTAMGRAIPLLGRTILTFAGDDLVDNTPPFVEVVQPETDSLGKLQLAVRAQDRSGLAAVALFKDGVLYGEKTAPPYVWGISPQGDTHHFSARAIDSSPGRNKGFSHRVVWSRNIAISGVEDE